jgi:recombinational DNA repair protein RecT
MKENTTKGAAVAADGLLSVYDRKAMELGRAIQSVGEDVFDKYYRTAIGQNPELKMCDTLTLAGALLQTIHLGLEVDQVELRPVFKTKESHMPECVFHIKHEGLLELGRRAGIEAQAAANA